MIQDSNAPNDMQPWVRQTEAEVDALKKTVERLSVQLQNAGIGSDVTLNSALNDTFNFSPQEDGSTSTTAGALEFDGVVSTLQPLNVQNSLVVGERTEFIETFDEEIGETVLGAGESAPYMEITPGSLEVNPVTEEDFYTPGTFKINDTSIDINGYGQISGDGLAITLNNPSAIAGYRADVLDVTSGVIYQENPTSEEGDPGDEVPVTIYEVEHNGENIEIIGVGQYVNITGCDPEELNESNALIVEIDLDPGVYLKFKILKDSSAITYVAGGEVSSNKPSEVYQSTLSVRGPGGANEFFGATVGPEGISVGPDGGNLDEAFSSLGRDGLITPSVTAIDSFTLNNTRVFIQSNEPDTPFEGDLWINPQNSSPLLTGYRYVQTLYYNSSGTFEKELYPWLKAVKATVVGGGGGGGGAATTGSGQSTTGGGGGGGGAAIANLILATSLDESVTVTVGAGGAGGAAGANNGSSGGASSFGTFASAGGGGGGDGQTAGTAPRAGGPGGVRAEGTVGDLLLLGSGGVRGFTVSASAGQFRPAGGSSGLFTNGQESLLTSGNGLSGKNPGTGGAGGGNAQSSATARSGGGGAAGIVILELYA
jgi:hypothetical protein